MDTWSKTTSGKRNQLGMNMFRQQSVPRNFWSNFTVTVPRHVTTSKNVAYIIECTVECRKVSSAFGWTVARRYSDFVALNQQVSLLRRMALLQAEDTEQDSSGGKYDVDAVHLPEIPPFPGTHWFCRTNNDESRIELRRAALEEFLQNLVAIEPFVRGTVVEEFLRFKDVHLIAKPLRLVVPLPIQRRLRKKHVSPDCMADITAEVSITITGASPTHKDEGLSFLSTSATCGEELPSELFERVPELREEGDGILVFA
eukprot:CAMPEP_0174300168 /NCGR_PEP_ID=MMETSP0809-20121228/58308_1 /TAXON_ID=73025 ORGANISM="Eutreptiella gymnastica-like, Strain CCMP1594" /NCGR_SAMPLE_ID=MMETSP0809 /ASSEMBLY_ACC=CAM_ASM_000658 /LENGTH=256 /DNA_ID=CAMNT_0015405713 /DNA_START=140 /DNA_END=910 /DNA_ORIENTATION=-